MLVLSIIKTHYMIIRHKPKTKMTIDFKLQYVT